MINHIQDHPYINLIPYPEMAAILKGKHKATDEEIRYWIKRAFLEKQYLDVNDHELATSNDVLLYPIFSDLPTHDYFYKFPDRNIFCPEYYFYDKQLVLQFVPYPHFRFVYLQDLVNKRNWAQIRYQHDLLEANRNGILNFYSHSSDDFSLYNKNGILWSSTFEGEDYVNLPSSFFLLFDILNVERIMFGKSRDDCLKELNLEIVQLELINNNVLPLNKKPKTKKDNDND